MKFKFALFCIIVLVAIFADQVLSKETKKTKKVSRTKKQKNIGKRGFCKGQTLNDGTQIREGSCSELIQGQIPSFDKMPSSFITLPRNEAVLEADKAFVINVIVENIETGKFSDPSTQYYTKPQELDHKGFIIGHTHVTIQKLKGNRPPSATEFEFFKGLNDEAKNGVLSVDVVRKDGSPGLAPGKYRVCTMAGSFTHQPVLMPIAQRGAQDDCVRISVTKKEGKKEGKGYKKGYKKGEEKEHGKKYEEGEEKGYGKKPKKGEEIGKKPKGEGKEYHGKKYEEGEEKGYEKKPKGEEGKKYKK